MIKVNLMVKKWAAIRVALHFSFECSQQIVCCCCRAMRTMANCRTYIVHRIYHRADIINLCHVNGTHRINEFPFFFTLAMRSACNKSLEIKTNSHEGSHNTHKDSVAAAYQSILAKVQAKAKMKVAKRKKNDSYDSICVLCSNVLLFWLICLARNKTIHNAQQRLCVLN